MKIPTLWVSPDEPCEMYFCGPKNGRMVEQVFVYRDDAIACWERDFGSAEDWPYVPPMMVPCMGEEKVGPMQDMGERHRYDDRWRKQIERYRAESTLMRDVLEQDLQRTEIVRNRSQFGPYINAQRNDWSREASRRRRKGHV